MRITDPESLLSFRNQVLAKAGPIQEKLKRQSDAAIAHTAGAVALALLVLLCAVIRSMMGG